MQTMKDLVKEGDVIEYFCGNTKKKGKSFPAQIEVVGKIFPKLTNDHITTLDDIVGTKNKSQVTRGLATESPGDLFQVLTSAGHRARLFAIEQEGDKVYFFKSDTHELKLYSILHDGEQPRVAEKGRELDNKVPGTDDQILFSEDLVQKAMKNSKVKVVDAPSSSEAEDAADMPVFVADKPKIKPHRAKRQKTEEGEKAFKEKREEEKPAPKKRGRPRKQAVDAAEKSEEPPKEVKKRGRPKKQVDPDAPEGEEKKRGRPKKRAAEDGEEPKPRGRPKKEKVIPKEPTLSDVLQDYAALGKKLRFIVKKMQETAEVVLAESS